MQRQHPGYADHLDECLAEAERLLARGVADRRSPFHTPALATIGADGAPSVRTVVLRGFEAATRTLRLHTDVRSAKAHEIARDGRVALHAYDHASQIQLRLTGTATLHSGDPVADAAWAASRPGSRLCYAVDPAPGTPIGAPLPAPAEEGRGADNFAAVLMHFTTLEFLWLAAEGHRRARFDWAAGTPAATWLVP